MVPIDRNQVYSLFNATIGSSLDAFNAGNKPANKLSAVEINHTLIMSTVRKMGAICELLDPPSLPPNPALNTYAPTIPPSIPHVAPKIPIINASVKNNASMCLPFAPIAFIVPISRVLSMTEVYRVVMIPTAPTTKDTIAMLKRNALIPPVNSCTVLMIAFTVVIPISLP